MLASDINQVVLNECAAYNIPWTKAVFVSCLEGKDVCWVIEDGAGVFGHAVVSYILDEAHLLNICVHPARSGAGHGRTFLRHLIGEAINKACSAFYLEVRVSNHAAIALYRTEGFNEVGVRPNYYPAMSGREDALLMTLELSLDAFA